MKKPVRHGIKYHLKRRKVSLIAIPAAILIAAGFLYWYTNVTEAKIEKINTDLTTQLKKDDAAIKATLARKAAELKARQEAEAKATADTAATADESTAASVDSSTCNLSKTHNNPSTIDVLVNKKHCMQPVTFAPGDLVSVGGGFSLSAKAAESFNNMAAAADAAGQGFYLTSSYRSYSNQVSTYAYWVSVSGADGADTYSARPGYSEHQTGLAFDVAANGCALDCFGNTPQYAWLQANAADYGFIQRYYVGYDAITGYKAEEWHYRYVGVAVAKDMQTKGVKTLEQYWNMTGGNYY